MGSKYEPVNIALSMGGHGKIDGMAQENEEQPGAHSGGQMAGTMGQRIRDLRRSYGMTQEQLSARSGVSQPTISLLERGKYNETLWATLRAIAGVLTVSPDWLRSGKGPPTEAETPTPDEAEALHLYRALPEGQRDAWLAYGRFLLTGSGAPSKAHPYPAKKR